MIPCPVTRAVDLTLPFMIVPHDYVGAATPTPYVKTPGVGVEIICLNVRWLGGMAMGKAKWANNVTHKSQGIVQEGNDMGPLVPQLEITPAPDNLLSFVHLLKSSCTVAFSCGDVQAEGTPVACILPFIMPMKICGDPITVPFGYSITNVLNDVIVYPHIVDILAGWADIIATCITDVIADSLSSGGPSTSSPGQAVLQAVVSAIVGPLERGGVLGDGLKQNIPGNVAALVRLVGRQVDPSYDGPVSFKVGYTQGMLGGAAYQVGFGSDGSVSHGPSGELAGGLLSGGSQTTRARDGSITETTTAEYGGFGSETDSRTVRPDGRVTETHTETENHWGGSTTETTSRTENPDGSATETRSVTNEQNTPILGTNRSSTSETTETTIASDGSRTETTTRTETRGGVDTSSRRLPPRSGEQEL